MVVLYRTEMKVLKVYKLMEEHGEAIAAKEAESPGGERASCLAWKHVSEVASFSQAQAQDMAAGDLINQLYKQLQSIFGCNYGCI